MEKIDESGSLLEPLDILILASGVDFRSYEILRIYSKSASTVKKVVVISFDERTNGRPSESEIFDYRKIFLGDIVEINCGIKDPSSCLEGLQGLELTQDVRIGLDISVLTKPYFYFIIKYLKEQVAVPALHVFYTEPKSYLFPKGLFNSFRTSSGPLTIVEVPGYSGLEKSGAGRVLIILLGFDGELAREIDEDVSPSATYVVNGFPSYTPKFKDISLIGNEKLIGDPNVVVKYAKANNPFEVYNLLEALKRENKGKDQFFNVAPLGTKPMALGACLFALHNPDVRIVYPLPNEYESKYTDKCWNSWMYGLPLSSV